MNELEKEISEQLMEGMVAENPQHFIGEEGLSIVSRQLSLGRYRFDLMFEDRHGGKLIVELQKGTLDRSHTYKILDYYDEYKSRNPTEFVEIMVIANNITAERKQRLRAHGIEFREMPLSEFISFPRSHSRATLQARSNPLLEPTLLTGVETRHAKGDDECDFDSTPLNGVEAGHAEGDGQSDFEPVPLTGIEARHTPGDNEYHFKSLGNSWSILHIREALKKSEASRNWRLLGKDSLVAINEPVLNALREREGTGLSPQIWMERPKNGKGVCKFEIAYHLQGLSVEASMKRRLELADSIRKFAQLTVDLGTVEVANGSTIFKCRIQISDTEGAVSETPGGPYQEQILKVVEFFEFLDGFLFVWLQEVYKGRSSG